MVSQRKTKAVEILGMLVGYSYYEAKWMLIRSFLILEEWRSTSFYFKFFSG